MFLASITLTNFFQEISWQLQAIRGLLCVCIIDTGYRATMIVMDVWKMAFPDIKFDVRINMPNFVQILDSALEKFDVREKNARQILFLWRHGNTAFEYKELFKLLLRVRGLVLKETACCVGGKVKYTKENYQPQGR